MSTVGCIFAAQSTQQTICTSPIQSFLLNRLPSYLLCSNTLKTNRPSSSRKPRADALTHQWVSFNIQGYVNAMTLDCDHGAWPHYLMRLQEQGIPEPTFIIGSPSGTAHLTWWFAKGKNKASANLMRVYNGIYERVRAELDADTQFKQYLTKNPLHPAYEVLLFTGQTYDLSDFLSPLIEFAGEKDYVLPPRWQAQFEGRVPHIPAVPKTVLDVAGPKGSRVFEIGHKRVHRMRSADVGTILSIYEEVAAELGSPIGPKALQGMARRSARWMAAHPNMLGTPACDLRDIDHGVMTREAGDRKQLIEWFNLDVTIKRQLAAERTNEKRTSAILERIYEGTVSLWSTSEIITQASLSDASSVCERTIRLYWNDVSILNHKAALRSNPFFIPHDLALSGASLTLKQLSVMSKNKAADARREQELICLYLELAKAMRCRGAEPQDVPPRGQNVSAAIKEAQKEALDARHDCLRRKEAREQAKEQTARRSKKLLMFKGWAEEGDMQAYQGFLAAEEAKWDRLQERIGDDAESRRQAYERRGSAFKRHRIDWESALRNVGQPNLIRKKTPVFRTQKDGYDLAAERMVAAVTSNISYSRPVLRSFLLR